MRPADVFFIPMNSVSMRVETIVLLPEGVPSPENLKYIYKQTSNKVCLKMVGSETRGMICAMYLVPTPASSHMFACSMNTRARKHTYTARKRAYTHFTTHN